MRLKQLCSFVFLVIVAGIFAGCARFKSLPISPEHSLAKFQKRSLDDPGLKTFIEANLCTNLTEWPVVQWDFQKLTLVAFYYNSDLEIARAQWTVADAGKTTAGGRPNPTLAVTPAYNSTASVPSPWLVTPSLDIPLETAGKRGYRIAQARELSSVARLSLVSVAWNVRGKVRKSLLDIYLADKTKALLDAQLVIHEENFRLIERQHEAGAISAFELNQTRLSRDSARLVLHDAVAQTADARIGLADALGIPSTALEGGRFSFTDFKLPEEQHFAQMRQTALLNRADIRAALAEYAASQTALQLEIAKQYPDVNLGPGYEYDQGNNKWSLGLTVTLPVLNQNQGAIKEATARRAEKAANFNAVQARAIAEIDRAWAASSIALQKRADAEAMLSRLEKQAKLSQAMYEAGEITKSDLAAQRLQLGSQALSRLDAQVKSQQALGDLEDALQTSLDIPSAALENTPWASSMPPQSQAHSELP